MERVLETCQPVDEDGVISLVPVDDAHRVNCTRWVKLAILLYRYGVEAGHCLGDNYIPTAAVLNPATAHTSSLENFIPWYYLEPAWFGQIYLTRAGTVVYLGRLHHFVLVDEEGLRTGRITLVDFKINGIVGDSVLRRPFNMREVYIDICHNGQGISDVREGLGGGNFHNQP